MSFVVLLVMPLLIGVAIKFVHISSLELKAKRVESHAEIDPMQRAIMPEVILCVVASLGLNLVIPEALLWIQIGMLCVLGVAGIYYYFQFKQYEP